MMVFNISGSIKVGDPCDSKIFDAPFTSTASDFFINDTAMFVATGGTRDGTSYRENADGFSVFSKNSWLNFNPLLKPIADNNFYLNINCVALDSRTGKLYAGSYWAGILQVENGRVTKTYDKTNSLLRGGIGDAARERISDMAFDKNGNLWVSNSTAANPLVVLKPDGTWRQMLPISGGANGTIQMVIDSFSGYKWLTVRGTGSGILVYDEGKSIDDLTDDQFRFLDASTLPRELQSASVTSLAFDLNGQLWVGTTSGVAVYRNCGNPFKEGCKAEQVASELGGIGEFLLREQQVNCITIDGANRIWFGTNNGIFVQTEGGRKAVAKFDVENSPLLSNNVTALSIRDNTGEVFIGTDKGLMVYKTDAIVGGEFNKAAAFAYPNPVRPDYQGSIAIKGLARDATIKITDINGNLVYETRSLGGQAIWDGRDFSGQRAATGVYLVYAANATNFGASDAIVTKILFVN
ncbi:MAG: hypothetical protein HC817_02160 [Saprospiraceae bacterium]|nr:hypothetical protein [Saprospiraceae bacterium]